MINIYKKCEKSLDNPSGYLELENIDDKPFLLCISAQNNNDKSIYGITRFGAESARVYTSKEDGAKYKVDSLDFNFLGVRFKSDSMYDSSSDELVDKFVIPYLYNNGNDYLNVIKKAKNMNFLTYCDGTETYAQLENLLKKILSENFSSDQVNRIISHISLCAIGTMIDTTLCDAKCVSFIDVNDSEICSSKQDEMKKIITNKQNDFLIKQEKENNYIFSFNGNGIHSLNEYLNDSNVVKPYLCSYITDNISNSINNYCGINEIVNVINFSDKFKDNSLSIEDKIKLLDDKINYYGGFKYTDDEVKIQRQLDVMCKKSLMDKKKIDRQQDEIDDLNSKMKLLINNLKEYTSDVSMYQVLISSGLWQSSNDEEILSKRSDKDIRKEYDNNLGKYL